MKGFANSYTDTGFERLRPSQNRTESTSVWNSVWKKLIFNVLVDIPYVLIQQYPTSTGALTTENSTMTVSTSPLVLYIYVYIALVAFAGLLAEWSRSATSGHVEYYCGMIKHSKYIWGSCGSVLYIVTTNVLVWFCSQVHIFRRCCSCLVILCCAGAENDHGHPATILACV